MVVHGPARSPGQRVGAPAEGLPEAEGVCIHLHALSAQSSKRGGEVRRGAVQAPTHDGFGQPGGMTVEQVKQLARKHGPSEARSGLSRTSPSGWGASAGDARIDGAPWLADGGTADRPCDMSSPADQPASVTTAVSAAARPSPDAPDAPPHALAPAAVGLWRLQRLVRLSVVGLPLYSAMGVGIASVSQAAVGAVVGVTLVLVNLILAFVWPPLQYAAFRYAVREHDLLVQSGVFFRRWSSVPLSRIQHVDSRQGPLERMFGVQRLLVYTAAGVSADGVIPALTETDATALRDALSRRGGDDGV